MRSASGRASLRDALAGNSSSGVSSEVSMEGSTPKRLAVDCSSVLGVTGPCCFVCVRFVILFFAASI